MFVWQFHYLKICSMTPFCFSEESQNFTLESTDYF